jgi:hypothetical protein
MRKRDELNDPTSCLNRAAYDEMTFVLLGRDRAAPAAVRAWVEERIRLGKNSRGDAQVVDAERWIATVEAEQAAGRHGSPRTAEPVPYAGRCPGCRAVVVVATEDCIRRESGLLTEWVQAGLEVERMAKDVAVAQLRRHAGDCPVLAKCRAVGSETP